MGDFFEAFGVDAVMLVQHAGLNPMGTGVPRAGTPLANLRRTVQDLVQAGLSVCICEEAPDEAYSGHARTRARKQRFLSGVVTPACPVYVHDMVEESGELAFEVHNHPVLSLAASSRGFSLAELDLLGRACRVQEGLTEEAVVARLALVSLSPSLEIEISLVSSLSLITLLTLITLITPNNP